jgi:Carboxypeptidase regulatory-like domain
MIHAGFSYRFSKWVVGLAALALLVAGVKALPSQAVSQASVSGQVADPTGAPVPGATVVLTIKTTGTTLKTTTDSAGNYRIAGAALGKATLTASAQGFLDTQSHVTVSIGGAVENITLKVGKASLQQTVEVAAVQDQPISLAMQGKSTANDGAMGYVTVSANAVAGPMGYVVTPSTAGATQTLSSQQQAVVANQKFNFPSIIFYISSAPLVNLTSSDATTKKLQVAKQQASQETKFNPVWLDASFTLSFQSADGTQLPNACSDGSVQVLGVMPQQTITAAKNQTVADISSAATDVAGALATVYPGSAEVTAATKAVNVLFQDLFPPKPVAFEYSYMLDNCNFGWYFRQNTSVAAGSQEAGEASILGMQTGIVMLKTDSSIGQILVNGRSLSRWSQNPTDSQANKENLFEVLDTKIGTIRLPSLDPGQFDYDNLTSLTAFPSLIPRAQAMRILHIADAKSFVTFATSNKLIGTDADFDYVTNHSLTAFLSPSAPAQTADQPEKPAQTTPLQQAAVKPPATSPAKPATNGVPVKTTKTATHGNKTIASRAK